MDLSGEQQADLVRRAREVRRRAYAPYSRYAVGAALLAENGEVFEGVNVENAAYPAGICAERAALFHALIHGQQRFQAIAVVSRNGGSPCGSCRQVLSEFGTEILVLIADEHGEIMRRMTVAELLPASFGPTDLPAS